MMVGYNQINPDDLEQNVECQHYRKMWIKHNQTLNFTSNPNEPEPDDLQFQICF